MIKDEFNNFACLICHIVTIEYIIYYIEIEKLSCWKLFLTYTCNKSSEYASNTMYILDLSTMVV